MKRPLLFIFFILISLSGITQVVNFPLNENWTFSEAGKNSWKPAIVPGNIHRDLLQNNLIKDPTVGENYKAAQWIEKKDWEYKNSFSYPDLDHYKNAELVFEGLDTYADVYLNDSIILHSGNMFLRYTIDVKKYLKIQNTLRIVFHDPVAFTKSKVIASGIRYPADNDPSSPFTRKEATQYGWDFTPRLVTCGIWRKVFISAWNDFIVRDLHAVQRSLDKNLAQMEAVLTVESLTNDTLQFELSPFGLVKKIAMKKGFDTITLPFSILQPKLWWPNGMGDPHLYDLAVNVSSKKGMIWTQIKFGLRTIEVVQQVDYYGSTFSFKVNGIDVYAKGSNYVPSSLMTKNISDEELFRTMKNCNMNMLRVWGGGIYESDEFYSFADKNGIMIWQDLMFAGTMYPGDDAFLKNVNKEIEYNVKRLRNHPSIALWCGNNEVEVAWKNWGWQKKYKYSQADSLKMINDYNKLFKDLIPKKIKELSNPANNGTGGTFYFSSSPISNWGTKEEMYYGDNHYWGVWHGEKPITSYQNDIPRFASEFGMQSFPEMSSLKKFSSAKDLVINSPVMNAHQFSSKGNGLITKYINENHFPAKDLSSYIYLSQLVQAEALKTAIETQRRSKPFCMGSLYWQLNDRFPAASWSSIDYYGKWKAAQYFVKKAFVPVSVIVNERKDHWEVALINDSTQNIHGTMVMSLLRFNGDTLFKWRYEDTVLSKGIKTSKINSLEQAVSKNEKNSLLTVCFISDKKIICSTHYYFYPVKSLALPKPTILSEFIKDNNKITLKLKTNVLAKNVFVSIEGAEMLNDISDNYFDLLPGEEKTLYFSSEKTVEELKKALTIKTVRDTY